ncbi:MAG: Xaa-Pro peptidase family protein [Proteobacteria bacterium]|nr:Xaa-Pro peptidase family protein [Pseudomonadota bacterium]MBU4471120.1 Xaa-Pro peptidase family protein [Pseudomonadota bacterium]MCG2750243.1 Xaa-Pro peptidase family protein [Desulfobacteraceae bacterium]
MSTIYQERLHRFRQMVKVENLDGFLISNGENRRYLSGFKGEDTQMDESSGVLIISENNQVLATDSRYTEQATQEATLYEVVEYKTGLAKELPDILAKLNIRRMGFESKRMAVSQHEELQKELLEKGLNIELVPAKELTDNIRIRKDEFEIDCTRKALAIAEAAFMEILKFIKPGMTEKEVAWALEVKLREGGADGLSFPVICASGPNSALPHAIPGDRVIDENEPIVFDWGAKYKGYCSDTTRTIVLGKPDDELIKVHQTVREAQLMAIDAIRAGANGKAVDQIARDHIDKMGYPGRFGHGLGHGTGLAIHEGPRLSPLSTSILEPGMIVTVEPGIYLPGWGGVRIEHQVVVREKGAEVLNSLSTTVCFDET